jgi:hypothetical protein
MSMLRPDTNSHLQYMLRLLDHKPDLHLDEIAVDLKKKIGVLPSLSTIHRSLKLLGYSTKKVSVLQHLCNLYVYNYY